MKLRHKSTHSTIDDMLHRSFGQGVYQIVYTTPY